MTLWVLNGPGNVFPACFAEGYCARFWIKGSVVYLDETHDMPGSIKEVD